MTWLWILMQYTPLFLLAVVLVSLPFVVILHLRAQRKLDEAIRRLKEAVQNSKEANENLARVMREHREEMERRGRHG